ncbi:MAG: ComEC/Rec2 family competence protein, partial [Bacteroidota bacterium]|nr:ComEC/Rec2 family competence protein [Bacteroidota bacterium]
SIFYFHQFPNYFIITNYFAIPLSSVAIYAGMLTLITSPLAWLSHQLALLFFGSVSLLNHCILFFGQLPYASVKGIQLSVIETLLIYSFTFLLYLTVVQKKKLPLFGALCCLLLAGVSFIGDNQKAARQKTVTVYSIKNNTIIDYFNGHQALSFQSAYPLAEDQSSLYQTRGNRIACGIRHIQKGSLIRGTLKDTSFGCWKEGGCFLFDRKRLIVQNGNPERKAYIGAPIVTDYLLLTRNPYPDIIELLRRYSFKTLILDGSNTFSNALKWKKLCNDYKIPCHYTASEGAYIFYAD